MGIGAYLGEEALPMGQLILMVLLLVSVSILPAEAEAQRCGHGYIRRISMGICVSKRSRLAMGFVKAAHTSRHGRRYHVAVALTPEPVRPSRQETLRRHEEPRLSVPGPEPRPVTGPEPLPVPAPDVGPAIVDLPFSIHGSILMQPPPTRAFGWLLEPKP
jgi:hypothetical protein